METGSETTPQATAERDEDLDRQVTPSSSGSAPSSSSFSANLPPSRAASSRTPDAAKAASGDATHSFQLGAAPGKVQRKLGSLVSWLSPGDHSSGMFVVRSISAAGSDEDGPLAYDEDGRRCLCRRASTSRSIIAYPKDLERLQTSFKRKKDLILQRDVIVGGELVHKGATLKKARPWRGSSSRRKSLGLHQDVQEARKAIKEAINGEYPMLLIFVDKPITMPWILIVQCPCVVFLVTVISCIILIAAGVSGGATLDTDFDSFMDSDGDASMSWNAFMRVREENSEKKERRLSSPRYLYKKHRLSITYVAEGGGNIMQEGSLGLIHSIEERLRASPMYAQMCANSKPARRWQCSAGISIANYVFPSMSDSGDGVARFHLNGSGTSSIPLPVAMNIASREKINVFTMPENIDTAKIATLEDGAQCTDDVPDCEQWRDQGQCESGAEHQIFMHDFCRRTCRRCDTGAGSEAAEQVVSVLRSHFQVSARCCTRNEPQAPAVQRMSERWEQAIAGLVAIAAEANAAGGLRMFYEGDGVLNYEAMQAVASDAKFAIMANVFVFLYAVMHTRSLILATGGYLLIMLSIPAALSIFILVSGSHSVSLMMCLSVFIVIGIGSDMLFVYTDFWKQSLQHSRDPVDRLKFTYSQASSSTAATTFTTAMSFLANLFSVLRPLREFGFFMGVCVVMAWTLMFLAYPAVLFAGERCHRRLSVMIKPKGTKAKEAKAANSSDLVQRKSSREQIDSVKRITKVEAVDLAVRASRHSLAATSENTAKLLDPEKGGLGEIHAVFLARKFVRMLGRSRHGVIALFLAHTFKSIWLALNQAEQDGDVPKIFPAYHNQVAGKAYDDLFPQDFTTEEAQGLYGKTGLMCHDPNSPGCDLYNCETTGERLGSAEHCECLGQTEAERLGLETSNGSPQRERESLRNSDNAGMIHEGATTCGAYSVALRFIGRESLTRSSMSRRHFEAHIRRWLPNASYFSWPGLEPSPARIDTVHWESGAEYLAVLLAMPNITVTVDSLVPSSTSGLGPAPGVRDPECQVRELCYCDMERCESSPSRPMGPLDLEVPADRSKNRRLQAAPAPLVQWTVRPEARVDVVMLFGLQIVGSNPLLGQNVDLPYQYRSTFDLRDVWAQRQALNLCTVFPEELRVIEKVCWLEEFKNWWIRQGNGRDWPVRPVSTDFSQEAYNFHHEVDMWKDTRLSNRNPAKDYIWFADGRIRAFYAQAWIDVNKFTVGSTEALEHMERWNQRLSDWNSEAKESIRGAFHCSRIWVRAEAEKVILDSTLITLMISLGCVLAGVVAFTRSFHLAVIVMAVVAFIIISLLFYMVVLMGWKIGAIEVLSLIVFVGFAVDYCLHVAHKYHSCHIMEVEEADVDSMDSESPGGMTPTFGGGVFNASLAEPSGRSSAHKRTVSVYISDRKPSAYLDISNSNNARKSMRKTLQNTMTSEAPRCTFRPSHHDPRVSSESMDSMDSMLPPDKPFGQCDSNASGGSAVSAGPEHRIDANDETSDITKVTRWYDIVVDVVVVILCLVVAFNLQTGAPGFGRGFGEIFFIIAFFTGRAIVLAGDKACPAWSLPTIFGGGPATPRWSSRQDSDGEDAGSSPWPTREPKDSEITDDSGVGLAQSLDRSIERFERVRYALERMGGAVAGSALTTIGCAAFLLPCTLHVFFKLGAVVCGVTLYAVIFSLFLLPAVLMVVGPCGHDFTGCLQYTQRWTTALIGEDDAENEDDYDASTMDDDGDIRRISTTDEFSVRRYVLNLPCKGMATPFEKGRGPSRTKIVANG